jgi:hypothetical protein
MNRQPWLVVDGCDLITTHIKGDFCTTTFMAHKTTLCITYAMVQLVEANQCLQGQFSTFKNLKSPFNLSKSFMGQPYLRRCQIATNWMYFFSVSTLPPFSSWTSTMSKPLVVDNLSFFTCELVGQIEYFPTTILGLAIVHFHIPKCLIKNSNFSTNSLSLPSTL